MLEILPQNGLHGELTSTRAVAQKAFSSKDYSMKIGFLSYPMLFQNEGGLQVQMRETKSALRGLGFDVNFVDTTRDDLADFDIIHIFAATQGNVKQVEQARAKGCRVIVSALLNPALVLEQPIKLAAVRFLGSLIARISGYKIQSDMLLVEKALQGADHVIALSKWERRVASKVFAADPAQVTVVTNGVSPHFFEASRVAFDECHKIDGPFVFCPGQISIWKNQISLVKAMAGTGVTVVLAGPVHQRDQVILDQCLTVPDSKVVYLGNLDRNSALFAGAYAAASAVVLPSKAESGPLVALEALAAGTPAVITRHNGLDLQPDGLCLTTVEPFDIASIRRAVLTVIAASPEPEKCKAIVGAMSWASVARKIAEIYTDRSV